MQLQEQIESLDEAVRQMLREDLPQQRDEIHTLMANGELASAASMVHVVHGSAAFCQFERLRRAAAELERSLKDNNTNADHLGAFDKSIADVLHALEHQDQ